jgi:hypothetical protein
MSAASVESRRTEARLGTDMIYYPGPTESFVLVQYKRLDPRKRSTYVDDTLMRQPDRLEEVAKICVTGQVSGVAS